MGQGDSEESRDEGAPEATLQPMQQEAAPAQPGPVLEMEQFLPYRLSVLASAVVRVLSRLYERECGLSVAEWRVLAILARFGPLSANRVGERAAMDKVRVSRAAARSLRSGLIRRTIDLHDRRRSVLSLTAKGRAIHDRVVPLARARETEILSVLTEAEMRSFNEMANRLLLQAIRLEHEGSLPTER